MQILRTHPRDSDLVGLVWGPGMSVFNKFLETSRLAGVRVGVPGSPSEKQWALWQSEFPSNLFALLREGPSHKDLKLAGKKLMGGPQEWRSAAPSEASSNYWTRAG